MKRCIVISHPSFEGGKEGIDEASTMAKGLKEALKTMVAEIAKANPDKDIKEVEKESSQYKVLVRKVDL